MECKICYDKFNKTVRKPFTVIPCGHTFCINCLNDLRKINYICPTCRVKIESEKPSYVLLELMDLNILAETSPTVPPRKIEPSPACVLYNINLFTFEDKVNIEFYNDHFKFKDFEIKYDDVARLILVPHSNGTEKYFVISLNNSIMQRNLIISHLVFLCDDQKIKLDISKNFAGRPKLLGKTSYEALSSVLTIFTDLNITNSSFKSSDDKKCVSCKYKNSNGYLYPLDTGFMFLNKSPIYMQTNMISCIKFMISSKTFDLEVEYHGIKYNFKKIENDEEGFLFEFINGKGIKNYKSIKIDEMNQKSADETIIID